MTIELINDSERYGFGLALDFLKEGYKLTRAGWNGKGMYLMLQRPDAHSKMTLPYIYMKTAQGDLVPWLASQTDVLATDWSILYDEKDAKSHLALANLE